MYKKGRVNSNSCIISTDEDPSLRIESSAIINLRGVSTKLNKYNISYILHFCFRQQLLILLAMLRVLLLIINDDDLQDNGKVYL